MDSHEIYKPPDYSLMDLISTLIPERVYFGGYPTERMMQELSAHHFTHIVNLTLEGEMTPYDFDQSMEMFEFPIPDHSVPPDMFEYCHFVSVLRRVLVNDPSTKMYIHCRGGHGRSGMLCVSLWMLFELETEVIRAIEYVNTCHTSRHILREKWRNRRMPFNHVQSTFLHRIHKNIFLNTSDSAFKFSSHYGWILPRENSEICIENVYARMIRDGNDPSDIYDQIKYRLLRNISTHRDIICRFQLTFLKSFKFVGVAPELDEMVRRALFEIRETLFYT